VSGGYPNDYLTGYEICGLNDDVEDTLTFHAGTKAEGDKIVTKGGRVICATGLGDTLQEAIRKSKQRMLQLQFNGIYWRHDIGYEFEQ
jgi:phosphoribosylamine--glycine ligase